MSRSINRGLRTILILLLLWPFAAWAAARCLIVRSDPSQADAIIVLAGSATYLERTHHAMQLFNAKRAPLIALTNDGLRSGWSSEQQRNPLFAELATVELQKGGVPPEKIEMVPGLVTNTFNEVKRVRDYARERQLKSILVVTSAYQSRRALWTLQHVFAGSGVAVAVDPAPPGEQSPRPAAWWWHRFGWKSVPLEYAKIIYYRIHY